MIIDDKISVVIPTFYREKLVIRSVKSVLSQTYKNIEVIVVDDCSTDNTESIIKKIKDKRLKYIKLEKNYGACYARNYGIKMATGKYIAFQDSDDVFYKDKLEKQMNHLKKNNSDLDFCKLKIFVDNVEYDFPSLEQDKEIKSKPIVENLCKNNIISTQAILAKKEIFNDEKFDVNLPRLQDYDLVLRLSSKYKVSYTKKILAEVYQQENSISKSNAKLIKACAIMIAKKYPINISNREILTETLMVMGASGKYAKLNNEYSKLCIEYGKLNDLYQKMWKIILNFKKMCICLIENMKN